MSKCCAYQPSRSPAGIFFGYQRSTKPGSDQLAVPMRIFPVSVLLEDLLVTHQRSRTRRRTQMGSLFSSRSHRANTFSIAQRRYRNYSQSAGWSSLVARQAHNLKAAGSNPAPATNFFNWSDSADWHLPPHIARARFTLRNRERKIQRSSVVERSAVNRLVVGSNPTAGAKFLGRITDFIRLSLKSHANGEDIFRITHCNRSSLTAVFITGIQWAFARC